jgi:hypothetical protein
MERPDVEASRRQGVKASIPTQCADAGRGLLGGRGRKCVWEGARAASPRMAWHGYHIAYRVRCVRCHVMAMASGLATPWHGCTGDRPSTAEPVPV